MPTYTYICPVCGYTEDVIHSMSECDIPRKCSGNNCDFVLERKISASFISREGFDGVKYRAR